MKFNRKFYHELQVIRSSDGSFVFYSEDYQGSRHAVAISHKQGKRLAKWLKKMLRKKQRSMF